MHPALPFIVVLLAAGCRSVAPSHPQHPERLPGETAAQALVGVAAYHELDFDRRDPVDPNNRVTADLSTMPAIGIAGQYLVAGEAPLEFGLDGSFLFSWGSDRSAAVSGGGPGVIFLDRDLLLYDFAFGLYTSALLDDRVRLYAGAGPNLVFGDADYADETISESDSTAGFGGYARGGIEFRMPDGALLGLGVRYVRTELDFGGAIGELDVEGWQGFLTYTQGF